MKRFRAFVFDMDGLLLDSERFELEAFDGASAQFGLGDLTKLFESCVGTNSEMRDAVLKEGLEGLADFREFRNAWEAEYAVITDNRVIPLKEGVEDLLNTIEGMGLPMAVATSSSSDHAKFKLQRSNIYDCFEAVIGGDQVSRSKPDPDIYLKAATHLGIEPGNCLALEDSPNGVRAAVSAGMTVVQIPDLVQPDEELLKLGHIVLESLREVSGYDFQNLI